MTDRLDQLAAALADRYRLEREAGAGGMATVYLAHDLRHDRKVALKVLRPELAAALGAERFLREIRTTANLRHPHIVPLYDSGAADGILYYVMPFIEGESLRDRLARERQLPLDEALRITREVADALGYAHGAGVIHRDIKPENILLERGHAVVTDFGIARAFDMAGGQTLTQSGIVVGTPAYMSPEQALPEGGIDPRSDLYALGAVLYEMLAGEPPYTGPTPQAITAKRMMHPVPKVSVVRENIPAGVENALLKVLAKAPADRFATASEFVAALTDGVGEPPPARAPRRRTGLAVLGLTALAVAAGALWLGRAPPAAGPAERPLIAVLPFRNAGASEDEFFADGVTEEITSRLGGVSGIGVISRTTALRYKGTTEPLRAIGRELGVQYILAGTIRADRRPDGAGEVRVTPELVRVSDETQIWTDGYTANLTPGEIFRIQAQIAEAVAAACGVRLLAGDRERVANQESVDPAAYDAYLRGRFQLNKRVPEAAREAIRSFEAAVALDPGYAPAWAALATAYAEVPFFPFSILPDVDPLEKAETAARRALALDSTLAGAHVALATVLGDGRWQWAEAEASLKRAIELDPGYAPAHSVYSALLRLQLRADSALPRPIGQSPWNRPQPRSGTSGRRHWRSWSATTKRSLVRVIARLQSPNPGLDATRRGWWYAAAGAPELAIVELERAVDSRTPTIPNALRFKVVERAVGHLPQYRALLTRVGLPQRTGPLSN
ncbi:MAG: protein kinase [Gemmatimonadetes bacterium]|nr:protein kinase [Gemmatimonadota bacterium]